MQLFLECEVAKKEPRISSTDFKLVSWDSGKSVAVATQDTPG